MTEVHGDFCLAIGRNTRAYGYGTIVIGDDLHSIPGRNRQFIIGELNIDKLLEGHAANSMDGVGPSVENILKNLDHLTDEQRGQVRTIVNTILKKHKEMHAPKILVREGPKLIL